MSRSFSIIIVTWNALDHIKTFLPSVTETDYPDFEIIIANNASADGTKEWVDENYPKCKIVTFDRNHGYCGGNNRAVDYASGDILVFLNNDVQTAPDWLTQIAPFFDNPKIAAVQPKLRSYTEPAYFEYAGAAGGFIDLLGYPFCRGRIFDTVEIDSGQYDSPSSIFWASGAALAIRRDVFEKLGRFDEDFEFHMEEIDLCWRIWNAGFEVHYAPKSVVYHLGGGSMPMGSPRKVFYNYRNNLVMFWKNAQKYYLKRKLVLRFILDGVAGLRSLLMFRPTETGAIIRAHIAFYGMWRRTHLKRNELQKKRKIDHDPELMIQKSIIQAYFIERKKTFDQLGADL